MTSIHRYGFQPDSVILEMPFSSIYETVKQRFKLMGFPITFPFAEALVFWGGAQHNFNAFALNPEEFARDITCPTLLLGGENDQRVPSGSLKNMAASMNGKTVFHLFEDAEHQSLFRASPEEYENFLVQFFKEVQ